MESMMPDDKQDSAVTAAKTVDELLSNLSPEARKIFQDTQAGLLSALQKEREAHDSADKKADTLEKAQQEAERKRLEESAEYEKLYKTTLTELTNLKPVAAQVEEAEKTMKSILDAQVAELPDDFKDVVPDGLSTKQKLDWLAKNKSKFMKAEPFDIGAGRRGSKPDKERELTAEQKQTAQSFGYTEEQYLKYLEVSTS